MHFAENCTENQSRIEEIFVPVYILDRIIENAILYFFKTIAFSSRVIKVCSNSENITQTKRLFILRRKLERHVKICNLGRISFRSPEHFHRICAIASMLIFQECCVAAFRFLSGVCQRQCLDFSTRPENIFA